MGRKKTTEVEHHDPPRTRIVIDESVTMTQPGRVYAPRLGYTYAWRAQAGFSIKDLEDFLDVVRDELTPELVSIHAHDLSLRAIQQTEV